MPITDMGIRITDTATDIIRTMAMATDTLITATTTAIILATGTATTAAIGDATHDATGGGGIIKFAATAIVDAKVGVSPSAFKRVSNCCR